MRGHSLELVTAFEQRLLHVWPVAEAAPVATVAAAVAEQLQLHRQWWRLGMVEIRCSSDTSNTCNNPCMYSQDGQGVVLLAAVALPFLLVLVLPLLPLPLRLLPTPPGTGGMRDVVASGCSRGGPRFVFFQLLF